MRRLVLVVAVIAACGDNRVVTSDAPVVDAHEDGALSDGPVADASQIDAGLDATVDATVDAVTISDAPIDDAPIDDAPIADAPPADASVVDAGVDAMPDAGAIVGGPPLGLCQSGWCWVYPLPQGNRLSSIWGTSASDVWALGDRSTLLHFDGTAWTEYDSNSPGWGVSAGSLWGTGPNDVWAAATSGGVLHWNGTAWSVSNAVRGAQFIGGTGPTDVWAYDVVSRRTLQWDGSMWWPHPLPGAGWPIAFGGAPGSLLVVSSTGSIAKWLGTAWGILDSGSHPANAAYVIDASHVVIAQNGGAVSFWDGSNWTTRTAPVAANWSTITATSFSDVWVAGGALDGMVYRYHWDGMAWSIADDPGDTGIPQALWEDASGSVWAALSDAEVRVWNGSAWIHKTVGDNYVQSVWGTAENDIWIVSRVAESTQRNRVTHWNGTAWSEVAFPYDTTYTLGRIWGGAPDDYWIAAGRANGNFVDRMLLHWTGAAWTAMGPYGTEDAISAPTGFTAVWGAATDDVYAVARSALYHYDGKAWTKVAAVPGGNDVFGIGADDVYVVYGQQLWHWDGMVWSAKTIPADGPFCGWINAPTDVWLGGGYVTGFHYDGSVFVQYTNFTVACPVGTLGDMFTFGFANGLETMIEWIGGFAGTTTKTTQAFFVPIGGWHAPDGHVYAVGSGLLVH